ncbi:MAG: DUF362 domain-containing protein [Erysipelotrichaceae bacterium]|nr:DUF362 domain-containing protein [Erysipelotrichaceae bacterium]
MSKSKVYFIKEITPDNIVKAYKALGIELKGKVAVKVHSGEEGNQNYLHPEMFKPIVDFVRGTVVECNTAYPGMRDTTEKHIKLMKDHGWSKFYDVDILDSTGPDLELKVQKPLQIPVNFVGKDISKYDSLLVLSHFKGHPMGGFGGALKQLSIGCASSFGKKYIHGAGNTQGNYFETEQDKFLESMVDAAETVVNYFKGRTTYVSVMKNISVDCDCCAEAEDPCMGDMGIVASLDPVAIDQACVDFVYHSKDHGKDHLIDRIEKLHGLHTIDMAAKVGIGSKDYELIEIK